MKISAALALFSMAYVSSTAKVIQQSTQLANTLAAVTGARQQATGFLPLSLTPAVASGSQTVTAGGASHSDPVSTTATHRTATQHSAVLGMNPGFPGGAYFPGAYPGSGAFSSFFNGASHGYTRATRPGLSTGGFSRYFREIFPGFFGRAYSSLYGSRLLGYGAAGWFPMDYAGVRVGFTVNPSTGQPAFPLIPVATGGPFPSSYPAQGSGPQPDQLPVSFPAGTPPGASATTSVGTAAVSQGQLGAPVMDGSGKPSAHLNLVQDTLELLDR